MLRLHQFALCPFSRKVRFSAAEKGVVLELVEEHPWAKSDALTDMNPAGQTPVLTGGTVPLADSVAITEYWEETVERSPLLGAGAPARAETRRLVAWFDQRFYSEVTAPLLAERLYKRVVARAAPDGHVLRAAARASGVHMDYMDFLLDHRRWLGGSTFGLADIAAAAHLSVADYLSGVDWRDHEQTRQWYSAMKSRPAFRPLLAERMEGIAPPPHYAKLDW